MAHYEYVKTFSSICSAKIPYRYICNSCGREVTGMIKLTGGKRNQTPLPSRGESAPFRDGKYDTEL